MNRSAVFLGPAGVVSRLTVRPFAQMPRLPRAGLDRGGKMLLGDFIKGDARKRHDWVSGYFDEGRRFNEIAAFPALGRVRLPDRCARLLLCARPAP